MTIHQQPETPYGAGPDPYKQLAELADPPPDQTQLHQQPFHQPPVQQARPAFGPPFEAPFEAPGADGQYYPEDDGYSPTRQRERFGGVNWGAALFGWMVTSFLGLLLGGSLAAFVGFLGLTDEVLDAESGVAPTSTGIAAAAIFLTAVLIASYAGGYVAGRMSRFDGGKQGVAVWLISLLLVGAAVGVGLLFGTQYADVDGIGLPALPLPTDLAGMQAVATGVVALVGALLASVAGGKVGCRYHRKVDDAAFL